MSDPIIASATAAPVTAEASVAPAATAPVQTAPEAAPAVAPAQNPADAAPAASQPGATPAPASDTTPAQAPTQESTPLQQSTSLLSEGAEAAKPKADQQPAQDPAQQAPVTYEPFKLPEGVQFDDGRIKTFTDTLGEFRAPQDLGQRLMDMHVAELRTAAEQISRNQYEVWEKTQNEWRESVKADPELGGNRYETTLASCKAAIRTYGGNESQQAELLNALTYTGAGNNPAIIRLIANMSNALKEGTPSPQTPPRQNQGERGLRRYTAGTS